LTGEGAAYRVVAGVVKPKPAVVSVGLIGAAWAGDLSTSQHKPDISYVGIHQENMLDGRIISQGMFVSVSKSSSEFSILDVLLDGVSNCVASGVREMYKLPLKMDAISRNWASFNIAGTCQHKQISQVTFVTDRGNINITPSK
jgi:hypothetical protein